MVYRKDIDVLRAISVLLVVFYHLEISLFAGGFIGVDVFFVISGYLITNIIVDKIDSNSFSLKSFYESRIRRIFPALFVMVLVVFFLCYFFMLYLDGFTALRRSSLNSILWWSNFYFYFKTGYFDVPAMSQVLLHTWSLSVEAQFYFIYPLFVAFAYKRWKNNFSQILIGGIVLSFACNILLTHLDAKAAFYLLPSRAWELILGGYIAYTKISPTSKQNKQILIASGLLLICGSAVIYNNLFFPDFPGFAALVPCLGAALYISGGKDMPACKLNTYFFQNTPLIFIGLISYSLYLWHWPVIAIYRRAILDPQLNLPVLCMMLPLMFVLAAISWRFIETPARKSLVKYKLRYQYALLALCLAVVLLPTKFITKPFIMPNQAYFQGAEDRSSKGSILGNQAKPIKFLLLGDSHAGMFGECFSRLATNFSGRQISQDNSLVNTYMGRAKKAHEEDQKQLKEFITSEQYEVVYISLRWSLKTKGTLPHESRNPTDDATLAHYINGDTYFKGPEAIAAGLHDTVKLLLENGTQKIYLILPVPESHYSIPQRAALLAGLHAYTDNDINEALGISHDEYLERHKETLQILHDIANSYPEVELIDTQPLFYEHPQTSIVVENGKSLYFDNNHLSVTGTLKFMPILETKAPFATDSFK